MSIHISFWWSLLPFYTNCCCWFFFCVILSISSFVSMFLFAGWCRLLLPIFFSLLFSFFHANVVYLFVGWFVFTMAAHLCCIFHLNGNYQCVPSHADGANTQTQQRAQQQSKNLFSKNLLRKFFALLLVFFRVAFNFAFQFFFFVSSIFYASFMLGIIETGQFRSLDHCKPPIFVVRPAVVAVRDFKSMRNDLCKLVIYFHFPLFLHVPWFRTNRLSN